MNRAPGKSNRRGMTLVEVIAAVTLLTFLLTNVFVAFQRSSQALYRQVMTERALAVAQRQMEMLIATGQEPNSAETEGTDDADPLFEWRLDLKRDSVGGQPVSRTSPIRAQVTVTWDNGKETDELQLVRYYASLDLQSGDLLTSPISPEETVENCLGSVPTPEQMAAYLEFTMVSLGQEFNCETYKQSLRDKGIPFEDDSGVPERQPQEELDIELPEP